ncbi:MAG: hypothetical protein WBA46_14855 [Thermomicrobiales bacterium]
MLPMNIDFIDTLIFERQHEIQRQVHRMAIASFEPHPVWSRLRAMVTGRGAADRTADQETMTTAPQVSDQPASLTLMQLPAPIEADALDRAA